MKVGSVKVDRNESCCNERYGLFHLERMNKKTDSINEPVMKLTCPTCSKRFLVDETPTPPFCCERCQLIDLGRWLGEEIGLPYEGDPEGTPVEYRDPPND